MKITILCVGKIKEKYFRDAIAEYEKRLGRYCKLEIVEVADEKTPDGASGAEEQQIRRKDVSVCGTGTFNLDRDFSRQCEISYFATKFRSASYPSIIPTDLPIGTASILART